MEGKAISQLYPELYRLAMIMGLKEEFQTTGEGSVLKVGQETFIDFASSSLVPGQKFGEAAPIGETSGK